MNDKYSYFTGQDPGKCDHSSLIHYCLYMRLTNQESMIRAGCFSSEDMVFAEWIKINSKASHG